MDGGLYLGGDVRLIVGPTIFEESDTSVADTGDVGGTGNDGDDGSTDSPDMFDLISSWGTFFKLVSTFSKGGGD